MGRRGILSDTILWKRIREVSVRRGAEGCFLWNSSMYSWEFERFSTGSQVLSSIGYPFQCTRYLSFPRYIFESTISSTSYSSTLSIISGGGGTSVFWSADEGFTYECRSTSLKTGWIRFHCTGNFNRYDAFPIFSKISNGPYRQSDSFLAGQFIWILVASSQTKSPIL